MLFVNRNLCTSIPIYPPTQPSRAKLGCVTQLHIRVDRTHLLYFF